MAEVSKSGLIDLVFLSWFWMNLRLFSFTIGSSAVVSKMMVEARSGFNLERDILGVLIDIIKEILNFTGEYFSKFWEGRDRGYFIEVTKSSELEGVKYDSTKQSWCREFE